MQGLLEQPNTFVYGKIMSIGIHFRGLQTIKNVICSKYKERNKV